PRGSFPHGALGPIALSVRVGALLPGCLLLHTRPTTLRLCGQPLRRFSVLCFPGVLGLPVGTIPVVLRLGQRPPQPPEGSVPFRTPRYPRAVAVMPESFRIETNRLVSSSATPGRVRSTRE